MTYRFEPMFEYSTPSELISYACSDVIKSFVAESCKNFLVNQTDHYSFYRLPYKMKSGSDNEIEILLHHKDYDSFKDMEKDPFIDMFIHSFIVAEKSGGAALRLTYGHYIEDYFETIKNAGYSEFSNQLRKTTTDFIKQLSAANDLAKQCDERIEFVKNFALKHNQNKTLVNGHYEAVGKIKKYNDLNVSAYYVDTDKLMFCCYASAMLYLCVFNDSGYVLYGQHNDYGFHQEEKIDDSFDSDYEDSHDRLFLKHALKPEFILMTKVNDVVTPYSKTLNAFNSIAKLIR